MAACTIDGVRIAYELIGVPPFVLTPGGRFSKDVPGIRQLALDLAGHGYQVLIWDRPNTGASDVCFRGDRSRRCRPTCWPVCSTSSIWPPR